jgi:hypothetical protein
MHSSCSFRQCRHISCVSQCSPCACPRRCLCSACCMPVLQAQPYFCENMNTGAVDPQQALLQLQQRQIALQQQQQQCRQRQQKQSANSSSSSSSSSSKSRGPLCFELPSEEAARVSAEASASFLGGNADRRQAAAVQHGPQWFAEFVAKVGRCGSSGRRWHMCSGLACCMCSSSVNMQR